jgi:2-keto-4-pentenoate hydratase
MDDSVVTAAAEALREARLRHQRMDALPEVCRPPTIADGYRVQDALVAFMGEAVVGWKIGSTSKKAQKIVGTIGPFAARILASNFHASPAALPADGFFMRALEAEFAFRLGADLPVRDTPYGRDEVVAAAGALHPAIEISDSRFTDWAKAGAPSLIADNGNEGQVIFGDPVTDWRDIDLPGHEVVMIVNGETVAEGRGANVLGDPIEALVWLANDQRQRGHGLRAGEAVITGSCTGVNMAEAGDTARAEFGSLGAVELKFT